MNEELQNYVLTLTEQDAKNAFENARAQAYLEQVRLNDTTAHIAWANAVKIMRETLWQDSQEPGTGRTGCTLRDKSWRPPLSLDNVKFAFYCHKARKH